MTDDVDPKITLFTEIANQAAAAGAVVLESLIGQKVNPIGVHVYQQMLHDMPTRLGLPQDDHIMVYSQILARTLGFALAAVGSKDAEALSHVLEVDHTNTPPRQAGDTQECIKEVHNIVCNSHVTVIAKALSLNMVVGEPCMSTMSDLVTDIGFVAPPEESVLVYISELGVGAIHSSLFFAIGFNRKIFGSLGVALRLI